jgi:YD repeat-containing protein
MHYFDSISRPTSSVLPNGGWTYTAYASSEKQADLYTGITSAFSTSGCSGAGCRHDEVVLDGLGRTTSAILMSDPDGQTASATTYDSTGRVASVSHAYRSVSDPTYGLETPSYDGMDRTVQVKHQDNTTVSAYFGSAASTNGGLTAQLCSSAPAGYPVLSVDESGNKRESWIDGFGRTIETDEPDSTGTLKVATCYVYNLNNNLTSVTNTTQSRSYAYDLVSRLTSSTTPEAGMVQFSYDSDAACPAPNSFPGQLVKRLDARGIRTCFQYDQLNRLVSKTYSDSTSSVSYFYDQTAYNGLSISYGKGRRTGMSDGSGQTAWSYNSVGSVIAEERTIATQTKTMAYSYNLDGTIASVTYPSGRVVNYATSGAERALSATDAANGFQYAILAGYSPNGSLEAVIYGQSITFGGISEARGFNNREQTTSIQTSSTAGITATSPPSPTIAIQEDPCQTFCTTP